MTDQVCQACARRGKTERHHPSGRIRMKPQVDWTVILCPVCHDWLTYYQITRWRTTPPKSPATEMLMGLTEYLGLLRRLTLRDHNQLRPAWPNGYDYSLRSVMRAILGYAIPKPSLSTPEEPSRCFSETGTLNEINRITGIIDQILSQLIPDNGEFGAEDIPPEYEETTICCESHFRIRQTVRIFPGERPCPNSSHNICDYNHDSCASCHGSMKYLKLKYLIT